MQPFLHSSSILIFVSRVLVLPPLARFPSTPVYIVLERAAVRRLATPLRKKALYCLPRRLARQQACQPATTPRPSMMYSAARICESNESSLRAEDGSQGALRTVEGGTVAREIAAAILQCEGLSDGACNGSLSLAPTIPPASTSRLRSTFAFKVGGDHRFPSLVEPHLSALSKRRLQPSAFSRTRQSYAVL